MKHENDRNQQIVKTEKIGISEYLKAEKAQNIRIFKDRKKNANSYVNPRSDGKE